MDDDLQQLLGNEGELGSHDFIKTLQAQLKQFGWESYLRGEDEYRLDDVLQKLGEVAVESIGAVKGKQIDAFKVGGNIDIVSKILIDLIRQNLENILIDELHDLPESPILKYIVVLVVEPEVLEDDVDHVHALSIACDVVHQFGEEVVVEVVFGYQFADYHAFDVQEVGMGHLEEQGFDLEGLIGLEMQVVFMSFQEGVHC
jgi:hypothetical protein